MFPTRLNAARRQAVAAGTEIVAPGTSKHVLPPLPYPVENGVGEAINPHNLSLHYNKHHNAYVNNLNNLVPGTQFEGKSIPDTVLMAAGKPEFTGIFNNAAQVWNHAFYWNCMSPAADQKPSAALLARINADFGSFETFEEEFKKKSATLFGSGWCWLVENLNTSKLEVIQTSNAGVPFVEHYHPLLTIDVWEHAYYPTFENRRPDYIAMWMKYINWRFVEEQLAA
eukprot:GCRY01000255.1.p1 GENE.GCRY01000255.1~~GCRY01000255.1.p1  ORF type:complete len:226 (-),score=59.75 GCRY01000255.1:136-813(-)